MPPGAVLGLARFLVLGLALLVVNFALPRLLPGDPLDPSPDPALGSAAAALPLATRQQLREAYRLDQPLGAQLAGHLGDLARGDLGWSIAWQKPVRQLIAERVPWTLGLLGTSLAIAAVLGILGGTLAAWGTRRMDLIVSAVAAGLAALPSFLVAMALLLVLGAGLGWFPLQGGRSPLPSTSLLGAAMDTAWHLALPGLTLLLVQTAAFVLLSRGVMGDVRQAPYLAAARAKGLSEARVVWRHALPNALPTLMTLVGLRMGHVFGGAIVVERVFSVPGLGLLAVEAVAARDYAVMQTVFLLGGLWVLLVTGLMELAYRVLVPQAAWIERPG